MKQNQQKNITKIQRKFIRYVLQHHYDDFRTEDIDILKTILREGNYNKTLSTSLNKLRKIYIKEYKDYIIWPGNFESL